MFSTNNTFYEVEQSNCDTALISLASSEAKGIHLPVGTDILIAEQFSYQYAKDKDVYVIPPIPYGTSEALRDFLLGLKKVRVSGELKLRQIYR